MKPPLVMAMTHTHCLPATSAWLLMAEAREAKTPAAHTACCFPDLPVDRDRMEDQPRTGGGDSAHARGTGAMVQSRLPQRKKPPKVPHSKQPTINSGKGGEIAAIKVQERRKSGSRQLTLPRSTRRQSAWLSRYSQSVRPSASSASVPPSLSLPLPLPPSPLPLSL